MKAARAATPLIDSEGENAGVLPARRLLDDDDELLRPPPAGEKKKADEPRSERRPVKQGAAAERPASTRKETPVVTVRTAAARNEPTGPQTTKRPATSIADLKRTLRQLGSPGTLAILVAGALAIIFALGMVVGRIVSSDAKGLPPSKEVEVEVTPIITATTTVSEPPASAEQGTPGDEAQPAPSREAAPPKAVEPERTKEQAVVTVDPVRSPARRTVHPTRKGGDRPPPVPKRPVIAKNAIVPPASPPQPKPPSEENGGDDLTAASAADDLARAQLEAVIK
jgi:hypothetical protein